MKKLVACLLCFLLLSGAAPAEPVSYGGAAFDSAAEYIDMGDLVVENFSRFIAFLQQFPNLKKVDMFATQIREDKVDALVKALPDVEFGWTLQLMKYKNKHIVRTDAEAFSTLHGICPNHYSWEFALLKYCTHLKALDLGHNNLTDISFLDYLPELRVLILGKNSRMKNIEKVGSLQHLEYLELFSCGITDISPLTKLKNLTDLNLSNNSVKDWRPLKEMKQLKRLWVSGMCAKKMTAAERQELQEALPDTQIMFEGEPTDNGWREDPATKEQHPHYRVVYEIFHTGVYIPFEDAASPPAEDGQDGENPDRRFMVEEDMDAEDLFGGDAG